MQKVKSFVLDTKDAEGRYQAITVGESEVTMATLVSAPDGIFYLAEGEAAGRFFMPMHMIRNVLMVDDE